MSDVHDWVQKYLDRGWSPVRIKPRDKAPWDEGWQHRSYVAADFQDDDNVGLHLGEGLYDVDLDSPECRAAADLLLPTTGTWFGRPSEPGSHRLYGCSERIDLIKYTGLGGNADTLVELRGWNASANSPSQTVVPPSLHRDTNPHELISWGDFGVCMNIADVSSLKTDVRNLAIVGLLARCMPHNHDARMALAGFLFRAGMIDRDILQVGKAVMSLIQGNASDWMLAARTTIAALKVDSQAKVTGGRALRALLKDGDEVLKKLNLWLGRTDQAAKDEVIERLNRQHFVVKLGATVCVGDDSRPNGLTFLTYEMFKKDYIKERLPDSMSPRGKFVQGKNIADFWLEHRDGRKFDTLVYAPPPIVPDPKDYNGWKGFRVSPVEGTWDLILSHIQQSMCAGDEQLCGWILNWCAEAIQRPGQPAGSAIVLKGKQGTGKGFFAEDLLGSLFDLRHFIKMSSPEQFYGRFAGEMLSGRCLVFLDEATWGGDKRDRGILKDRVTSKTLLADRKGISAVNEPSMLHLIIASNEDWIVGLDGDDRRFVVLELASGHANDPAYFVPLYEQLNNGGREAFLHAMFKWDVDEAMLRQPPRTKAKDQMKQLSLPPFLEWVLDRLHDGQLGQLGWPEEIQVKTLYEIFLQWAGTRKRVISQIDFSRKVNDVLIAGKTFTKRVGKDTHRFAKLKSLAVARADWDKMVKSETVWEDETDDLPLQF